MAVLDDKRIRIVPQRQYALGNNRLPNNTPIVGLGCSSFSSFFSSEGEEPLTVHTLSKDHPVVKGWIETIRYAVLGRSINLLDTAPWYGHGISEIVVGYALDTILASDDDNKEHSDENKKSKTAPVKATRRRTGSLPRSSIIMNTKVGRYEANPLEQFDFSHDTTLNSVHRSLERLNCTYIDIIQLHDPEFAPDISILMEETIPALLECRRRGWVKAIGMTGYPLDVQHQILVECQLSADKGVVFDQALVYCHNNLHDMSLFHDACFPSLDAESKQSKITYSQFCQQSNIHLMAAAPLSMGLLTNAGPPDWHPAASSLKEACASAAKLCQSKEVNISTLAILFALSQREVGCTLLGMKDIDQVDIAADLAVRFSGVDFNVDARNDVSGTKRHESINKVLDQVLTSREKEVLAQLLDTSNGPFASVTSNEEYRWNGKEEARRFWALVDDMKTKKHGYTT